MSLIYCLITEPACRCPTQPRPFSLVDVNTHGHLPVVQTSRAGHAKHRRPRRAPLWHWILFFFFFFFFFYRYVASGMTSEARRRFGANRLSSKGGSDNL